MDPIDLYGMHITFFEYGNVIEKLKKPNLVSRLLLL